MLPSPQDVGTPPCQAALGVVPCRWAAEPRSQIMAGPQDRFLPQKQGCKRLEKEHQQGEVLSLLNSSAGSSSHYATCVHRGSHIDPGRAGRQCSVFTGGRTVPHVSGELRYSTQVQARRRRGAGSGGRRLPERHLGRS